MVKPLYFEPLYSGHLYIADTFSEHQWCPLLRGFTVYLLFQMAQETPLPISQKLSRPTYTKIYEMSSKAMKHIHSLQLLPEKYIIIRVIQLFSGCITN